MPQANPWIRWDGGANPAPGQVIDLIHRSGDEHYGYPSDPETWSHGRAEYNIIAYRLTEGQRVTRRGPERTGQVDLIPPLDDGWRQWHGGECPPQLRDIQVQVILRDGNGRPQANTENGDTWDWDWSEDLRGWEIVRYRTLHVRDRHLTPLEPVQPELPAPRSFMCPVSNSQCMRAGCTVMHCDTQAEQRAATPPRRPVNRTLPTQGVWRLGEGGGNYVYADLPSGDSVGIAGCDHRGSQSLSYPSNEDECRNNARRIAMIPRMERILRDVAIWHGQEDQTGHRYSGEWMNEAVTIISELDRRT